MKIGIFGGTFDPIHIGHIISVMEVKLKFGLDKVIFIPARQSPHKETRPADDDDRVLMVEKAIAGYGDFHLDRVELDRKGVSYTYDTAVYLKEKYPHDELFFLMGTDQYKSFEKWYRFEDLLEMMKFIVMMRHSDDMEIASPFIRADQLVVEVSSTLIRRRIGEGLPFRHFLDASVYEYIKENALYETQSST
ncbi:nicotinate-nucleotide adenylyltransferase [Salinicoccus kekensis]|uniref:Probable nicotinate-nucleotide adenylyltransferase n=1 Tax=Salinicoccus kekensis TaxID=714307 RepID=A0A285U9J2_9STAP|nr:nicotinate-nucleotide adenylyltransferase [Salinicoccus kekensis]SOC38502.1 nicotinate-nucleotide adenylyltransferase [Salinicoccus kekensis]